MDMFKLYIFASIGHLLFGISNIIEQKKFALLNISHIILSLSYYLRNEKIVKKQPVIYCMMSIIVHGIIAFLSYHEKNYVLLIGQLGMIIHYITELYIHYNINSKLHTDLYNNPNWYYIYNIIIFMVLFIIYSHQFIIHKNNFWMSLVINYLLFIVYSITFLNDNIQNTK
jgi:hypothetical protein